MCKYKFIKYLIVNTNSVRLTKDEVFVARLANLRRGFRGAFVVRLVP